MIVESRGILKANKLINRIQGLCLLISSLPDKALRMPRDSTIIFKALPGKLDIKRHSPSILYLWK